jgi:acylphosphatase
MERVHLIVLGDVHGVGYRFTVIEVARDLGLVGWVKNKPDGSVEIVAEGPREKLENLITWAKKGPPLARVDNVKINWQQAGGEFNRFDVKY